MQSNQKYIDYLKNFGYMQGVNRQHRIKQSQEIFTPIKACLYLVEYSQKFSNNMLHERVADTTCGDGEWLGVVLMKRLEAGVELKTALLTLLGCDLEKDNIEMAKKRLTCGSTDKEILDIISKNIVVANALHFHYRWDNTDPYKTVVDAHFDTLFDSRRHND